MTWKTAVNEAGPRLSFLQLRTFEKPLRKLFKEIGLTADYLSHPSPHFLNGGATSATFFLH